MIVVDESDASEPPDSKGTHRQLLDQRRLLVMQLFETHGLFPDGKSCYTVLHPVSWLKSKINFFSIDVVR